MINSAVESVDHGEKFLHYEKFFCWPVEISHAVEKFLLCIFTTPIRFVIFSQGFGMYALILLNFEEWI